MITLARGGLGPSLSVRATQVSFVDDYLSVDLEDGRRISVPIVWFPRLLEATPEQRSHWRLIGRGIGINWPDLDEDVSVEGLLATGTAELAPGVLTMTAVESSHTVIEGKAGSGKTGLA